MEVYKCEGIYGEGTSYVLRTMKDWDEYETILGGNPEEILKFTPGFYQIKEQFKEYIGKTWTDRETSSRYVVEGIEDNTAWCDWYWISRNLDDPRDIKYSLSLYDFKNNMDENI